MISIKNLTFDYPEKRALHNVSFEVQPGTITAVAGPNGAGKSTLFRCIAALDTPTTGGIVIDGLEVLENPREAHTKMGYLPDFFGLYDTLTVERCLLYHAMVQRIPKAEQTAAVLKTAQQLQMTDLLHKEPKALSRGQRQRLAIGQAIIHQPKVIILDEPASGLDPEARHTLSKLLLSLSEIGHTILVSSHILSELEDYCSHLLIIKEGRIMKHCAVNTLSKSMIDTYLETMQKSNPIH